MKFAQEIIHAVRSLRSTFNLVKERPSISINLHNETLFNLIKNKYTEMIAFLSSSSEAVPLLNQTTPPEGCACEIVNENCEVYLMIKGKIDVAVEIDKFQKKLEKTQDDLAKIIKQTESPHYHKIPEKVRSENSAKVTY